MTMTTVLFLDLSRFTALTDVHGDRRAHAMRCDAMRCDEALDDPRGYPGEVRVRRSAL